MNSLVRYCCVFSLVAVGFVSSVRAEKNIVETAVGAGSFNTLVAAVKAADLVDTLSGPGPFTVFAPTDEAFAALPDGTVETLLKPENKQQLVDVLTYHVVPGRVSAAAVVKLAGAKTVNGQRVDIVSDDQGVRVDGANVVSTDINCSNGIIHVIDQVILPAGDKIPAVATQAGTFATLLAAAQAADLVPVLNGDQPLTVFAPTDDAFGALPAGTVANVLKPENKAQLVAILKNHVVAGRVYSEDAVSAGAAQSLQGGTLKVVPTDGGATINGARLVQTDLDAANGVIHVIDRVLLPSSNPTTTATAMHSATAQQHSRMLVRNTIQHAIDQG
ncbi:MAG: fasciclin domain-containing protein, partial [Pirellulaceae bacterium]|nr:fasciclin domain-containing protein [Pirellulaceae bacterium]